MHHDQHHGVLYLSLSSSTASQALLEQADVLARATSKQAVHAWLVEKSTEHTRALLLLFHLSHAVLVMSDARCVDIGLLRQLRSLHTLKQTVQPTVQVALKPVLQPTGRGGGQRNEQRSDQRSDAQLPTRIWNTASNRCMPRKLFTAVWVCGMACMVPASPCVKYIRYSDHR